MFRAPHLCCDFWDAKNDASIIVYLKFKASKIAKTINVQIILMNGRRKSGSSMGSKPCYINCKVNEME